MKTSLASLCAALLLGLSGTLLVASPAIAQPRAYARADATIERFTLRAPSERIRPGDELQLRLAGSARGQAWVDIPGVVSRLELAESRPGIYEGTYVVRRRDDPDAFERAVGTLRVGRDQVSARVDVREERGAERRRGRDERAPQISALTPAEGQRVPEGNRTEVSARLADDASGVDARSVRLRISGRDVTADSRVSAGEVQFRGDLRPGRYTAEVTARDNAGNAASKRWTFDVVPRVVAPVPPPRPPHVAPPAPVVPVVPAGPLTLRIISPANNAVVDAAANVTLQGETAPHASVHVRVDTLVNTTPPSLRAVVDRTLEAGADGRFSIDTAPSGFVLPGSRYDVRITATRGNKSVEQRLTLQRR